MGGGAPFVLVLALAVLLVMMGVQQYAERAQLRLVAQHSVMGPALPPIGHAKRSDEPLRILRVAERY